MVWRLGAIAADAGEQVVVELEGRLYALADLLGGGEGPTLAEVFDEWARWRGELDRLTADPAADSLDADAVRWLPPLPATATVVCAGANYAAHRSEMGEAAARPEFPYAFVKPRRSLSGHREQVEIPARAEWVDWEGELGVVIGSGGRDLEGASAAAAIAGFCQFNDVSARDWIDASRAAGMIDMFVQKGFDGFGPVGPLVTPSHFVADPQDLGLQLAVNGVVKQDSSTAQMTFSVLELVAHVSSVTTLRPGDLIATGSPPGVGFGRDPRERLADGDVVTLQIERLGPALETRMFAARSR
ncbi:MAG TPA: fumarylacetoacetate hydrolase family protein [Solirubrobacterales bacterium]